MFGRLLNGAIEIVPYLTVNPNLKPESSLWPSIENDTGNISTKKDAIARITTADMRDTKRSKIQNDCSIRDAGKQRKSRDNINFSEETKATRLLYVILNYKVCTLGPVDAKIAHRTIKRDGRSDFNASGTFKISLFMIDYLERRGDTLCKTNTKKMTTRKVD